MHVSRARTPFRVFRVFVYFVSSWLLLIAASASSPSAQSRRSMTVDDVIDHIRIRDTEEISWLMKYAGGIEWKASERKDADKAAEKKTTDQFSRVALRHHHHGETPCWHVIHWEHGRTTPRVRRESQSGP